MSIFLIKLIALILMFLDHLTIISDPMEGWNFIDSQMCLIIRYLGRIVFPIFAFGLVNGFLKTKNLSKYMTRMWIFAAISQIPYTLALYVENMNELDINKLSNLFKVNKFVFIVFIIVFIFWIVREKKVLDSLIVSIFVALIVSAINCKLNNIWVLYNGDLNIIYTLSLGLMILSGIDRLKRNAEIYRKILIVFLMLLSTLYIGTRASYGIGGIALILLLYLARKRKVYQSVVIILWSIIFYGVILSNVCNALFASLSGILILLYNGQKGKELKYLFYSFYPIHLFLLGLINIYFKFK